jgi:hypothetical protein
MADASINTGKTVRHASSSESGPLNSFAPNIAC